MPLAFHCFASFSLKKTAVITINGQIVIFMQDRHQLKSEVSEAQHKRRERMRGHLSQKSL
jgi:hypothetical protein